MNSRISILLLSVLLGCSLNVFADTDIHGNVTIPHQSFAKKFTYLLPKNVVFSLNAGNNIAIQAGAQQSLDDGYYNYSPSSAAKQSAFLGGFFGIEYELTQDLTLQVGVALSNVAPLTVTGTNSVSSGSPTIYAYNYTVKSHQFFAEARLLKTFAQNYHVYGLLDIGRSFTSTSHYQTNLTSTPGTADLTPTFADQNNSSFAYGLGVGVERDLIKHLRFGVGYRLLSLGRADLGGGTEYDNTGTAIATTDPLTQSDLYVQQLVAQLTYRF
jgi:opacity protein-like surface antigen